MAQVKSHNEPNGIRLICSCQVRRLTRFGRGDFIRIGSDVLLACSAGNNACESALSEPNQIAVSMFSSLFGVFYADFYSARKFGRTD